MPSKPYTLSSLKTLLTMVYHTNNNKYIFKLYLIRDISGTIHTWTCIYIGLFLLQIQRVHSGAGNRYTYMKSKSKNITMSTNASGDLLTTQTTTTIMSTKLFTTSIPMPLPTTTK